MKDKILMVSDSLEGPTGFATNGRGIAWSLADDYDVHCLGLQSMEDRKIELEIQGEKREIVQHRNFPRDEEAEYDFGQKALPNLVDKLDPDLLLTINDIQMIQHIPSILCPNKVQLKMMDLPSKDYISKEALKRQIEGLRRKYKEKYPLDVKWLALCFTPDTKVMTLDGMKYINEIEVGDLVYSWNPNNELIEPTKVIDTQKHKVSEELVSIKHQKADFKVTKDHIFNLNGKEICAGDLLELSDSAIRKFPKYTGLNTDTKEWFNFYEYFDNNYIIRAPKDCDIAEEFGFNLNHSGSDYFLETKVYKLNDNIFNILENDDRVYAKSKPRNGQKIPLRVKWKDFLSIAGWYISEGFLDKHSQKIKGSSIEYTSYRVNIAQCTEKYRKEIMELLDRMGIRYHVKDDCISFNGKFYYKLFERIFHNRESKNTAKSKYIPKWMLKYEGLDSLFKSLMNGDGHWDKRDKSVGQYYTISEELKDDFIILSTLLGYKTGVYYDGNKFTITVSESETQPLIGKKHIDTENYSGYVYDITLEDNNYFFAGRNDKYTITHNCPQDGHPPMRSWGRIYGIPDQVVAMSKYGQKVFKDYFGMKVPYIYHGVNPSTYNIPDKKIQSFQDKFIVGDINRNQPRKQPVRVIEAFAQFAKDKDDVYLHLQKDWRDRPGWPLDYFVKLYGIQDKIVKPKPVGIPNEAVAELMGSWDVNMMCSAGEGFGLPTIEAGACKTATIHTDYTTGKELIKDGNPSPRGQLVDCWKLWQRLEVAAVPRSIVKIDDLVSALNKYYYNRDLLEQHSENAHKWAMDNVTWKDLEPKWKKIVKKTLDGD